jgi:fructokinase
MSLDPRPIVIGAGELLWDCFPEGRRAGGAPANVAFHADQLGCHGVIVSRVGHDDDGRELLAELARHDLETGMIQVDEDLPTGRVTVDITDPGRPEYRIHEDVAWDALAFDESVEALMRRAAAICVGTLAQRCQTSRRTLQRCLDAASGALRVYDVNLRPDGYRREWIEATLAKVQIVKLNLDEVDALNGMFSVGADGAESFASRMVERFELDLVCITRAERGCLLVSESERIDVPGTPVDEADAVGAGDAFTAALIIARLRGFTLEEAGRLANDVGAFVARRHGAMPESRARFAELLASVEAGSP